MDSQETKPKDAGMLVMLVVVILSTLVMAWVADQTPTPQLAPTATLEAP